MGVLEDLLEKLKRERAAATTAGSATTEKKPTLAQTTAKLNDTLKTTVDASGHFNEEQQQNIDVRSLSQRRVRALQVALDARSQRASDDNDEYQWRMNAESHGVNPDLLLAKTSDDPEKRRSYERYDAALTEAQILAPGKFAQKNNNQYNRQNSEVQERRRLLLEEQQRQQVEAQQLAAPAGQPQSPYDRMRAAQERIKAADAADTRSGWEKFVGGTQAVAGNMAAGVVEEGQNLNDILLANGGLEVRDAERGRTPFIGRTTEADRLQMKRVSDAYKAKGMQLPPEFFDGDKGLIAPDADDVIRLVEAGDAAGARQALNDGWVHLEAIQRKESLENLADPNYADNPMREARLANEKNIGGIVKAIDKWADVENEGELTKALAGGARSMATSVTYQLPYMGVAIGASLSYQQNVREKLAEAKQRQEATGEAIDYEAIQTYAAGATVIDAATERLNNVVSGFKAGSAVLKQSKSLGGALIAAMRGMAEESAEDFLVPTVKEFVKFLAKGGFGEGAEEFLSAIGTGILAKFTTNKDDALYTLRREEGGLINVDDVWSSFVGGAFMGLLFPVVTSTKGFVQSRAVIRETLGAKRISDVTEEDIRTVAEILFGEGQKPEAKQALAARLDQAAAVVEPEIVANADPAIQQQTLEAPALEGQNTEPAAETMAAPEPDTRDTADAQLAQATTIEQGVLPSTKVSEPSAVTGQRVASDVFTVAGKDGAVSATVNGATVEIRVPSGVKGVTRTLEVPVSAFENQTSDDSRAAIAAAGITGKVQMSSIADAVGGRRIDSATRQAGMASFYRAADSVARAAIGAQIRTTAQQTATKERTKAVAAEAKKIEADAQDVAAAASGSLKSDSASADTKIGSEGANSGAGEAAQAETKGRDAKVEKLSQVADRVLAKTQSEQVAKDVTAENERMRQNGINGYLTTTPDNELTKRGRQWQKMLEEVAPGKKVVFLNAVGESKVREFVPTNTRSTVYVVLSSMTSEADFAQAVGHGLYHALKDDPKFRYFTEAVTSRLGGTEKAVREYVLRRYGGNAAYATRLLSDPDLAMEEIIADQAGFVFTSPDFWREMAKVAKRRSMARFMTKVATSLESMGAKYDAAGEVVQSMLKAYNEGYVAEKDAKATAKADAQAEHGSAALRARYEGFTDEAILADAKELYASGVRSEALYAQTYLALASQFFAGKMASKALLDMEGIGQQVMENGRTVADQADRLITSRILTDYGGMDYKTAYNDIDLYGLSTIHPLKGFRAEEDDLAMAAWERFGEAGRKFAEDQVDRIAGIKPAYPPPSGMLNNVVVAEETETLAKGNIEDVTEPEPLMSIAAERLAQYNAKTRELLSDSMNTMTAEEKQAFSENMESILSLISEMTDKYPDVYRRMTMDTIRQNSPFRSNTGGYIWSLDMDTSCTRALDFRSIVDETTKRLKRQLTREELLTIVFNMRAAGIMIPCVYCYVESKRQSAMDAYNSLSNVRQQIADGVRAHGYQTVDEAWAALKGQMYGADGAIPSLKAFEQWFENAKKGIRPLTPEQLHVGINSAAMEIMDILDDPANGYRDTYVVTKPKGPAGKGKIQITGTTAENITRELMGRWGIEEHEAEQVRLSPFVLKNAERKTEKATGRKVIEGYTDAGQKLKSDGSVAPDLKRSLTPEFRALRDIVVEWLNDLVQDPQNLRGHTHGIYGSDRISVGNDMALFLGTMQETQDYMNSSSSAKKLERFAQYVDQITRISVKDKVKMNARGGARVHSSNDARIDHYLDYILAISHFAADKRGPDGKPLDWLMHAYTKDLTWARFFRNTGMRINVSIAMTTKRDGTIVQNTDEGADWTEVQKLRVLSGNIGSMAMVVDDAQLLFALESPWIDMIIPFHKSGMLKAVFEGLMNYKDYESIQRDVAAKRPFQMEQLLHPVAVAAHGVSAEAMAKMSDEAVYALYLKHGYVHQVDGQWVASAVEEFRGADGRGFTPELLPYAYEEHGVTVPGHNADAATYFDMCKHYGIQPRFYDGWMKDTNGDVIRITEHPNYVKLIKEGARTDSKQQGVKAEFDPKELVEIMEAHAAQQGYAKEEDIRKSTINMAIVNNFLEYNMDAKIRDKRVLAQSRSVLDPGVKERPREEDIFAEGVRPPYVADAIFELAKANYPLKQRLLDQPGALRSTAAFPGYDLPADVAYEKAMRWLEATKANDALYKDLTREQQAEVVAQAFGIVKAEVVRKGKEAGVYSLKAARLSEFGPEINGHPGFYSPLYYWLVDQFDADKPLKMPGDQWLAKLAKAPFKKEHELRFLGMEDWLKEQKKAVSAIDLAVWYQDHSLMFEEYPDINDWNYYEAAERQNIDKSLAFPWRSYSPGQEFLKMYGPDEPRATFRNYRQKALVMGSEAVPFDFTNGDMQMHNKITDKNVLAFTRIEDALFLRDYPGGVTYGIEVQSDAHSAAQQNGGTYMSRLEALAMIREREQVIRQRQEQIAETKEQRDALQPEIMKEGQKLLDRIETLVDVQPGDRAAERLLADGKRTALRLSYGLQGQALIDERQYLITFTNLAMMDAGIGSELRSRIADATDRLVEILEEYMYLQRDLEDLDRNRVFDKQPNDGLTPDLPYKEDYMLLGFKMWLRDAVINGHDAVMWSGWTHAARWGVPMTFAEVEVRDNLENKTRLIRFNGQHGDSDAFRESQFWLSDSQLEGYFGREMAAKVRKAQVGEIIHGSSSTDEYGEPIQNSFIPRIYDEMLPPMVNKYLKKWGAKAEYKAVDGLPGRHWVVEISDQMRNDILENPQPAYSQKADRPGAASIEKALKTFGSTRDVNEAGYILPDGWMLDFSGKKDGGEPGYRSMDHREIASIYDDVSGTKAMDRFTYETGAMRFSTIGDRAMLEMDGPVPLEHDQVSKAIASLQRRLGVSIDYYRGEGDPAPAKSWYLEKPRAVDLVKVFDEVAALKEEVRYSEAADRVDRVEKLWTESPAFKARFGQSKARLGRFPTRVYHGTAVDPFGRFAMATEVGRYGSAVYFSTSFVTPNKHASYTEAQQDGETVRFAEPNGRIIPAYLRIENPFKDPRTNWRRLNPKAIMNTPTMKAYNKQLIAEGKPPITSPEDDRTAHPWVAMSWPLYQPFLSGVLSDLGYDGVMEPISNSESWYAVFSTDQIIPAFGPESPDTLFSQKRQPGLYGTRYSDLTSDNNDPALDKYGYWEDLGSRSWLEANQKLEALRIEQDIESREDYRHSHFMKLTGELGADRDKRLMLPPKQVLRNTRGGVMYEERSKDKPAEIDRRLRLLERMKANGYVESETDFPIMIYVDSTGSGWIAEGNHRLEAAYLAGIPNVPLLIKYWQGGQMAEGPWKPDRVVKAADNRLGGGANWVRYSEAPARPAGLNADVGIRRFFRAAYGPELKTLVTALIDSLQMYYGVRHNADTAAEALKLIQSSTEEALLARVFDRKSTSAVDTALRMILALRYQELGTEAGEEQAARIIEAAMENATNAGQAVQAFSMFQRLSPAGTLLFADSQIRKSVTDKDKKKLKKDADAVADAFGQADAEAAGTVAERAKEILEGVLDADDVKRLSNLEKRLAAGLKKGKFSRDPLVVFVDVLHQTMLGTMNPQQVPDATDGVRFIKQVITSMDTFGKAWETAAKTLQRVYKGNEMFLAELEAYLGKFGPMPFLAQPASQPVTPEMAAGLANRIRGQYAGDLKTFEALVLRLRELGTNFSDSILLAREIQEQMGRLTEKQKLRALRKVLPPRPGSRLRDVLAKIINVANESGLTDQAIRDRLAEHMGIPVLDDAFRQQLLEIGKTIADIRQQAMKDGRTLTQKEKREIDVQSAMIVAGVTARKPQTFLSKVATVQSMAMLINGATMVRNLAGNVVFGAIDLLVKDPLAATIDAVMAPITGNNRVIPFPHLGAYLKGAIRGAREGLEDIQRGVDTSALDTGYGLPKAGQLKSRLGRGMTKVLNYELALPDRIFQSAAYDSHLAGLMALAKAQGYTGTEPTPEMVEAAQYYAQYKTFTDDNVISKALSGMKKAMNLTLDWGAGDAVLKFPKVPGALLMRSIEYSPVGFMTAAYELLGGPVYDALATGGGWRQNFGGDHQRRFANSLASGVVGTISTVGLGILLRALGLISGRKKDDPEEAAMETKLGMGTYGYTLNYDGLWRTLLSGELLEAVPAILRGEKVMEIKPEPGDRFRTYSWMAPVSIGVSMGANFWDETRTLRSKENKEALDYFNLLVTSTMSGIETMSELSVLSGLQNLMNKQGYRSSIEEADRRSPYVAEQLINVAANVPASFIPSMFRATRNILDNSVRQTFDTNAARYALNLMANKLPGLSKDLPAKTDLFGDVVKVLESPMDTSDPASVLSAVSSLYFSPYAETAFTPNDTAMLILSTINEKSANGIKAGLTSLKVPAYIKWTVKGEEQRVDLTKGEVAEMQKWVAEEVTKAFQKLDPKLTVADRIKAMNKIVNDAADHADDKMLERRKLSKKYPIPD